MRLPIVACDILRKVHHQQFYGLHHIEGAILVSVLSLVTLVHSFITEIALYSMSMFVLYTSDARTFWLLCS